jgi:chromosome segregation ATPase
LATAEQISSLGERVSRIEGGYEHLATKADLARVETDLAQMRSELKAEIAGLDGKISGLNGKIAGLDGKAAGLDGKVEALRSEIRGVKWWIASAAAAVVAFSGQAQLLPLGG